MDKFPVNQGHVAGLITKATFNEEAKRVNLAVLTTNGDKQQFMNVLISGEERYNNFKKDFEIAKVNLGTRQNDKNETKQNFPLIKITGEAFFSVNTHNEIKNKNYTLIASGNLEERTDKYFLTTTPEQVTEFRKTHNSFSVDNNVLQIRGTIASEPKIIKGKNNTEFASLTIAHNYLDKDCAKVSWADVIIPTSQMNSFKMSKFEKGSKILLDAIPASTSYTNRNNEKVYSFNLITKAVTHDLTNSTTIKKAAESIDKVASVTKSKERGEVAEQEKKDLKSKKSNEATI